MLNRFLLTCVVVCSFGRLVLAADTAASPRIEKPVGRPNILFILTDDQRWDAVGHSKAFGIQTPNIDALAAEGVRFRNMFVTTAICAASRATILTGLHERTHRYTFGTKPITAEHAAASYPRLLKDAGYRTGHVGKFGVAVADAGQKAMYDVFTPLGHPYLKKQPDGTERHLTDIEAENAIKFIEGSDPAKPWCLSLCFNSPHAEDNNPRQYIWAKESDGLYEDLTFVPPATMAESFFESQPDFIKNSESRKRFKWRFDEPAKYQEMVRGYFRMIADVDRAIGRVRKAVADKGQADNTVIVFTADNGYFLGDRGLADKWYIYEESIRVPLIIADPLLKDRHGAVIDQMALNLDLAPTMLARAGIAVPRHYQGRSLLPLLTGEAQVPWRDDFFYEHLMDANGPGAIIPKSEGVRNERFTYVRWFQAKPLVEELYDHEADFHCTKNLIADPAFAATADALRKRTTELRDQYGGPWVSNAAEKPKRK
ncbi:sulfatase family protein [Humisphaera borealis]|uniref:Sulfatase n=1 Tax=Humisphaera borealis TaxID=2807512 RepID=A0A7M2WYV2_9BACT|nr:sulfatase [Humisphaera borealis]QOV90609.1 sulfatase [Humisphaera borealis]